MPDKESYVRTVPPGPRGLWLVGALVGLVLAVMVLYCWSLRLPLVQRANIWPFWEATAGSWVSFSMKPGPTRAQFIHEYMRSNVFGGLEPWEFVSWPLLIGGVCVLI